MVKNASILPPLWNGPERGLGASEAPRAALPSPGAEGLPPRQRRLVRTVFVLLPLAFALQLGVVHVAEEPYPGLFQPSFGGKVVGGRTASTAEPLVTATYEDGSTATFSHRQVMAQSRSLPSIVFASAFDPRSPRHSAPATVAWLEHRLTDLGGGRHPERAVIEWRTVAHPLDGAGPARASTTARTSYTFGGGRG
jgi:hypothetical protein